MPDDSLPTTERKSYTTVPISEQLRDKIRVRLAENGGQTYDEYFRENLSLIE